MNSKQHNGKKLEIVLLTIGHNTKKLLLVGKELSKNAVIIRTEMSKT